MNQHVDKIGSILNDRTLTELGSTYSVCTVVETENSTLTFSYDPASPYRSLSSPTGLPLDVLINTLDTGSTCLQLEKSPTQASEEERSSLSSNSGRITLEDKVDENSKVWLRYIIH